MSWLDAIGWAGSALLIWSLLQTRILRLRVLNLIGCLVLLGFNWALGVWPMVGLNVVLAGINAYFLRRLWSTRHDEESYAAVEVGAGNEFLAHVLRTHSREIKRFNPGFDAAATTGRLGFIVVRGDETVGVVLLHDRGDGVAQIDLDYVAPRFRDFTPGEFVFRRSGVFARHGFTALVTPPGMVAPYYERVGFRRDGDRYRLDLPVAM
ncbi:hypothetical protein F4553_000442 [Allocatelliglobosispora scoriae]|uniref:YgjV family protein n=1 Tax=Allocatelliglobosispora scoriae TaxID=643052 RepID=A0A841BJ39_9ACTN|nr:hypothetical protein [Allocatelliglobosispora scoriae]MBB5867063.1 hypothetical protein [Allocatelliglobosispora scoriae]